MQHVARWKGDGSERGHWRVFCPVCSERLGTLRPIDRNDETATTLATLGIDTYLDRLTVQRPVQPLPYRKAWVVIAPPGPGQEYRQRRDGSLVIRERAAIAGRDKLSSMQRGGKDRTTQLAAVIDLLQAAKHAEMLTSAEVRDLTMKFVRDQTSIRAVSGLREISPGNIVECPRTSCRRNIQIDFPEYLTLAMVEDSYLLVLRRNDPILQVD